MPPISSKRKTTSHLKSMNTKKSTKYGIWNPGPILGRVNKCGWVKLVNGNTDINKQLWKEILNSDRQ